MTDLTELEHTANEEARHGNREALETAQARIAELEGPDARLKLEREFDEARRIAWNSALEAAEKHLPTNMLGFANTLRALKKKEGE